MVILKEINGYSEYYVNIYGQVYSTKKGKLKELKLMSSVDGYLYVELSKGNIAKAKRVHRLVAEAFICNTLDKPEVNHIDGHKDHNNYLNLEWCTAKENSEHAVKTGLQKSGEDSNRSKITKDQASMIIILADSGINHAELGRRYGISRTQVRRIVIGTTWKSLDRESIVANHHGKPEV